MNSQQMIVRRAASLILRLIQCVAGANDRLVVLIPDDPLSFVLLKD